MKATKCTSGAISIRKNGDYGILEIQTSSYSWGGICDDLSGNEEGFVICKMLGYSDVESVWIGKGGEFGDADGLTSSREETLPVASPEISVLLEGPLLL